MILYVFYIILFILIIGAVILYNLRIKPFKNPSFAMGIYGLIIGIFLSILLLKYPVLEKITQVFNNKYKLPDASIKYSYQIKSNGVFANNRISKGDIIEVCPAILEKTKNVQNTDKLTDYHFQYGKDNSLIALGYCSMYNHSDKPNANWQIVDDNTMRITALENIGAGEEIFVSYGDKYWKTRTQLQKK
jgi:hypothetical protein